MNTAQDAGLWTLFRQRTKYYPRFVGEYEGGGQHRVDFHGHGHINARPQQLGRAGTPGAVPVLAPRQLTLQHQLHGVMAAQQPIQMAVPMPGLAPLPTMPGLHPYVSFFPMGKIKAAYGPFTIVAVPRDRKINCGS